MDTNDLNRIVDSMSLIDIWEGIDAILSSGVDINYILQLGEPYPDWFVEQYEYILDNGADPMWLFRHNEEWYSGRSYYAKELAEIFLVYHAHGMDRDFLKSWLLGHIREIDIVPNAYHLEPFGINPRDYVDAYLEHKYSDAIRNLSSLPSPVTPNDVVQHFSVREIKHCCTGIIGFRYCGFTDFVDGFIKVKGDVNLLADKFLFEIGYPEDEDDLAALAIMKHHGANEVDANKIIDALTDDAYIYKDIASVKSVNLWFYKMLAEHLDEEHLKKLKN